jgi:hypothetical protein
MAGLLLFLVVCTTACVETFDARTLGTRTSLSARAVEQPQGEAFKITRTTIFLFWGIGAASPPSLDRLLASQITGDAEISNLRVTSRARFSDVLVSVFTAFLVVPRGITYEGVIVHPAAPPAAR